MLSKELIIEARHLKLEDYHDLRQAMEEAYSDSTDDYWERRDISRLLDVFPEGQLCIAVNNKVS